MKVMMLIQTAEEKGNWSSKKYEISKWSFGDAYPVTEILFTATPGFSIQILDDKQINNELVYFLELFLSQEPNTKLNKYICKLSSLCVHVCYLYYATDARL